MPRPENVKVRPGDAEWDLFVQWLYHRDHHGIDTVINHGGRDIGIVRERRRGDMEFRFLNPSVRDHDFEM